MGGIPDVNVGGGDDEVVVVVGVVDVKAAYALFVQVFGPENSQIFAKVDSIFSVEFSSVETGSGNAKWHGFQYNNSVYLNCPLDISSIDDDCYFTRMIVALMELVEFVFVDTRSIVVAIPKVACIDKKTTLKAFMYAGFIPRSPSENSILLSMDFD